MKQSGRRPKLGQHFLASSDVCRRIADSVAIASGDLLVEIGPGRGAMTRLLLPRCRYLTAVEIDPALATALREEFQGNPKVEILKTDILKTSLDEICRRRQADRCYVFGNLPYYITSPILSHLFACRSRVLRITALLQLEVARRITAQPGNRDYGYLSVFVQCLSVPKILFEVPPGAFTPPPKVFSALVDFRMVPRFPAWDDGRLENFLRFAQRCFGQKRKNLLNNLAQFQPRARIKGATQALGLSPSARAEELSIEELASIFGALK